MLPNIRPPLTCTVEGAFATRNPVVNATAFPGALQAAPGDLIMGRFGWADLGTGTVANVRTSAEQRLGFVELQAGTWQRVYSVKQPNGRVVWFLRSGQPVTLAVRGDFWAKFAGGARAGDPVYASQVDGSAISGYAAGAELTPWAVETSCGANGLAIITTWASFS